MSALSLAGPRRRRATSFRLATFPLGEREREGKQKICIRTHARLPTDSFGPGPLCVNRGERWRKERAVGTSGWAEDDKLFAKGYGLCI